MSTAFDPDLPTIVFDLDGTLAETAPDLIWTLNAVLAEIDLPPIPFELARDLIGAGARALINRGLAADGRELGDEDVEKLFNRYLEIYETRLCVETHLFEHVPESLDILKQRGHRMAVCTNKMEYHSLKLIDALGIAPYFSAICGRDTFAFCKPDARHLTHTVLKAGGDPAKAIMIGDSRTDIDTALNANLPSIGVPFGYTDTPMAALGPDVLISHFRELPDAVMGLVARR
ncbi:MAG: phosphoglycolate phosphatase [Hyphomicrobiales bacterium]|nr:phosphoglycolate phosphatase [Hyphomicrobiales bacterium]